jgi:hypothetical protein
MGKTVRRFQLAALLIAALFSPLFAAQAAVPEALESGLSITIGGAAETLSLGEAMVGIPGFLGYAPGAPLPPSRRFSTGHLRPTRRPVTVMAVPGDRLSLSWRRLRDRRSADRPFVEAMDDLKPARDNPFDLRPAACERGEGGD